MKRWTLVLFLLLMPFTMAPRMALTPDPDVLDVVLHVSRVDVESGDRVNVVGQATNVSEDVVRAAFAEIVLAPVDVRFDVTRLSPRCEAEGEPVSAVLCDLRDLKPGQRATFSFAMVLTGHGTLELDARADEGFLGATTDPGEITVTDPTRDSRS